jgi:hypothetical protein
VRGDGVAGAGHGDVGEQQPGDALAFAGRGGGVVPDAGQVGDELGDPGFLGLGELPVVLLAGLVVGGLGVVERAEGGVPVGFEGAGDEAVGGVDGEVAAAGQVGVVDLPRAFRTADLRLIHAADCCSRYSSWTCCGVRY